MPGPRPAASRALALALVLCGCLLAGYWPLGGGRGGDGFAGARGRELRAAAAAAHPSGVARAPLRVNARAAVCAKKTSAAEPLRHVRTRAAHVPSSSSSSASSSSSSFSASFPSRQAFPSRHDKNEGRTRGHVVGSTATSTTTEKTVEDKVIQSPNDDREYKTVQLANGLEVLLVSDPEADNAAAAMAIRSGSWSDPEDVPGLAHFLEHMLFLGTEKYPVENDYSSFLNQHGGGSNAFTSSESTVYYFTVDSKHLFGALDRFAQFFIAPLFNPDCVQREINAIDSEHKQYLQSDFRRAYEVIKSLTNPTHPFSRFATGDKTTLGRDDIRDRLLEFHKQRYSANQMRLTITGKESLDKLESWAKELFTDVPNNNVDKPQFDHQGPVIPASMQGQIIDINPIADEHSLLITWPVDMELKPLYRKNPQGYLGYVLSSEARGGLVSTLKAKEWISSLSGRVFLQSNDLNVFSVSVDLTDTGIAHVDEVVKLIYDYLNQIKQHGIEEDKWTELINLAETDFRFSEKGDPGHLASSTAGRLLDDFPLADLLNPPRRQIWNPDKIQELIKNLTPDKMTLVVSSKKRFASDPKPPTTEHTEKWYGTQYRLTPIKDEQKRLWSGGVSSLSLPPSNPYIPDDFSLVEEPLPFAARRKIAKDETGLWNPEAPKLLINDTYQTLWHTSKSVKEFPVPRVQVFAVMRTDKPHQTPKHQAMTELYFDMVGDHLTEELYLPGVAGYSFSMGSSDAGFTAGLQGYSQGCVSFLSEALKNVKSPPLNPQRFGSIKEETERAYENFYQSQPYEQASFMMSRILNPDAFSIESLQEALKSTTLKDVEAFIPQVLNSQWSLESLVHGNVDASVAKELTQLFRQTLQGSVTEENSIVASPLQQRYQLDSGKGSSYVLKQTLRNPEEQNSCCLTKIQLGDRKSLSTKDLAIATLLGSMISEPAFDELRTKQQLGYIVSAGVGVSMNVFALSLIVQGAQHTAQYYDDSIESFLHGFKDMIQTMPKQEIDQFKASLESALLRKDLSLMDRGVRFWDPIGKQLYNFQWNTERVKALRSVTREDILKFYNEKVLDPETRRRLSVWLVSNNEEKEKIGVEKASFAQDVFEDLDTLRGKMVSF